MNEHVGLELADEEKGHRARVAAADRAGVHGPTEVVRGDAQAAARRCLLLMRVERNDEGGRVHVHGDGRTDDGGHERDELLGEAAQDDARVGRGVDAGEVFDERRNGEGPRAHRRGEELLLARAVAEEGRGRDVERSGDLGEGRRGEAALGERGPGGVEDLIAGDAGRAAHL